MGFIDKFCFNTEIALIVLQDDLYQEKDKENA